MLALQTAIDRCEDQIDSGRHVNVAWLDKQLAEYEAELDRVEGLSDSEFENEERQTTRRTG